VRRSNKQQKINGLKAVALELGSSAEPQFDIRINAQSTLGALNIPQVPEDEDNFNDWLDNEIVTYINILEKKIADSYRMDVEEGGRRKRRRGTKNRKTRSKNKKTRKSK
jgi:hypothetical protein